MVEFDDKGQGYWDFILENFSEKIIEEVGKQLEVYDYLNQISLKRNRGIVYVEKNEYFEMVVLNNDGEITIHHVGYNKNRSNNYLRSSILDFQIDLLNELKAGGKI